MSTRSEKLSTRAGTLVYLVLVALTVLTWAVGVSGAAGLGISLFVLAVALVKGHLIGDWFMGLRWVRGPWRWVVAVWLLLPGALITWAFMLAHRS